MTFESGGGAPSAYEVNGSDFKVSDVEGDMTEEERAIKRKEKIKKKMNERAEKKALALFNEKMKLKNEKKSQQDFHAMSHTYKSLNFQSSNLSFSTVPMGKPLHFDGTDYARWSEDLQVHLYGLNPHLWTIVCVGVPQLGEDEVVTPEHEHDLFRNAQTVRVIKSSLCTMKYNKVRRIISAK